jgi:hypothetical protein
MAVVDAQFRNARTNRFGVTWIAANGTFNPGLNSRPVPQIMEILKSLGETRCLPDFNRTVAF